MTGQSSSAQDRTGAKTVYFIRHAESMENEKHKSMHRVIENLKTASMPNPDDVIDTVELLNIPSNVDTAVTARGKLQIANVAQQLQQDNFVQSSQIALVVHSPLQRAQETAEGLLQCRADRPMSQATPTTIQRVVQLDALRERTPDEIWIPWRRTQYNTRKQAFMLWLMEQPETVIAVVGHSEYFKSLLHLPFKFGHVDVWRAEFRPFSRKKWFGLERLYRPQLKSLVKNEHEEEEEEEDEELKGITDEEEVDSTTNEYEVGSTGNQEDQDDL